MSFEKQRLIAILAITLKILKSEAMEQSRLTDEVWNGMTPSGTTTGFQQYLTEREMKVVKP